MKNKYALMEEVSPGKWEFIKWVVGLHWPKKSNQRIDVVSAAPERKKKK